MPNPPSTGTGLVEAVEEPTAPGLVVYRLAELHLVDLGASELAGPLFVLRVGIRS